MPPLPVPPLATPPLRSPGEGIKAQVRVELNNCVKALIRSLGILKEVKSDEGKAILSALKALAPVTPDVDDGVSQSELKALIASAETAVPGPGGARPTPPPLGPMPPTMRTMAGPGAGMTLPAGAMMPGGPGPGGP
jgi:hypothetical protein